MKTSHGDLSPWGGGGGGGSFLFSSFLDSFFGSSWLLESDLEPELPVSSAVESDDLAEEPSLDVFSAPLSLGGSRTSSLGGCC